MKSEQESEILKLSQNIAIHPNDDSIYNQRGQIFYQSGKFKEAINDFTKTIAINANIPEYYNNLAEVFAYEGDTKF